MKSIGNFENVSNKIFLCYKKIEIFPGKKTNISKIDSYFITLRIQNEPEHKNNLFIYKID